MTHDPSPHAHPGGDDLPGELRLRLRGLRRESPPARDLWPDIAARLPASPQMPATGASGRGRPRALSALALAAVLVLALGAGWRLSIDQAPGAAPAPAGTASAPPPFLREADAMTREYEGALREITASRPLAGEHPELRQLDASAAEVRQALSQSPDARFLLHRLQRIYGHRLDLTRRYAQA